MCFIRELGSSLIRLFSIYSVGHVVVSVVINSGVSDIMRNISLPKYRYKFTAINDRIIRYRHGDRESRVKLSLANPPFARTLDDRQKPTASLGDFGLMYRKSLAARLITVSFAGERNELSLWAGRERPECYPVFSHGLRPGEARGARGLRHSTVTKGNHHRSGGAATSSGHKLSKSRRYFAAVSFAERNSVGWWRREANKRREGRYVQIELSDSNKQ